VHALLNSQPALGFGDNPVEYRPCGNLASPQGRILNYREEMIAIFDADLLRLAAADADYTRHR